MPPLIQIPNVTVTDGYAGKSLPPRSPITQAEAIKAMSEDGVNWVLFTPPSGSMPGTAIPYTSPTPRASDLQRGQQVALVREALPRNIVWMGAEEYPLNASTIKVLTGGNYTHVIVCFVHFEGGLKLVYNGPQSVDNFDKYWPTLQQIRGGILPKTLMISLGGWNSGSWAAIEGKEDAAAGILASFVATWGFDGVDINFEGGREYSPDDPTFLASVGKLVVGLRTLLPQKEYFITITPMQGHVTGQLDAIKAALRPNTSGNVVDWVNVEFDTYSNEDPGNDANLRADYPALVQRLQTKYGLTASQVTAGFGLWGESGFTPDQAGPFGRSNEAIQQKACQDVVALVKGTPDFGGAFVWNYRATRAPVNLDWSYKMSLALAGIS